MVDVRNGLQDNLRWQRFVEPERGRAPRTAGENTRPGENDALRAWRDPHADYFQAKVGGPTAAKVAAPPKRSPEAQRTIDETLQRLGKSNQNIDGWTPKSIYKKLLAENPDVTDEQILGMSKVKADALSTPEKAAVEREQLKKYNIPPDAAPHLLARELMAGIVNAKPEEISRIKPEMGIMGSSRYDVEHPKISPGLSIPDDKNLQLGSVLHDVTSDLKDAGVKNLNQSVWGSDSNQRSALLMRFWYHGLPSPAAGSK